MEHPKLVRRGEWLEILVPGEYEGATLRAFLQQGLRMGAKLSYAFINDSKVKVHSYQGNVSENYVIESGDRVLLHVFAPEELDMEPDLTPIHVIYEDDHMIVVNKPAGVLVHPNQPGDYGTMVHRVYFHGLVHGESFQPRPIHRLDQDTSGGVIFAKHEWTKVVLDDLLRHGEVKRDYVALVEGCPAPRKATIDLPIGRDRHHATRRRVSDQGQQAVTHYEVMEVFHHSSLVHLRLETGRTHQIRVHMSHIGHPLLGDALYGGSVKMANRQALHGGSLRFNHPLTGEVVHLDIPWSEDFAEWVQLQLLHR